MLAPSPCLPRPVPHLDGRRALGGLLTVTAALVTLALGLAATAGAAGSGAGRVRLARATAPSSPSDAASPEAGDHADSGSRYLVRRGDSLSEVAALHDVEAGDLAAINDLAAPYRITAGDRLRVPRGRSSTPPPESLVADPARASLDAEFDRWAAAHSVPPDLLKAVAWRESRWEPDALSPRGAVGVGQLMPHVAGWVETELVRTDLDLRHAAHNIRLSSRYLAWLLTQTGNDEATAVAAYYQGLPSIRSRGWYPETVDYVDNVFDHRASFRWS